MSQPASELTTLPRSVSSTELQSPKCFGELSTAFTKHLGLLDAFSGVKHISKWEVATPDIRSKSRYKVSTSYSDVLASHNQHFSPQKGSPSRRSPTHENLSPGSLKAKYSVLPSILPEPKDVGTPGFFDRCLGAALATAQLVPCVSTCGPELATQNAFELAKQSMTGLG